MPLTMYSTIKKGRKTGIYYIDGTCLPVCHLKRSKRHKVFDGISEFGKTSVGWFFGLKLHLVINNEGQLIAFKITKGNALKIFIIMCLGNLPITLFLIGRYFYLIEINSKITFPSPTM